MKNTVFALVIICACFLLFPKYMSYVRSVNTSDYMIRQQEEISLILQRANIQAAANKVIASSISGIENKDDYFKYLFISNLSGNNQIVVNRDLFTTLVQKPIGSKPLGLSHK